MTPNVGYADADGALQLVYRRRWLVLGPPPNHLDTQVTRFFNPQDDINYQTSYQHLMEVRSDISFYISYVGENGEALY